jgi:hypothetical protein
MDFLAYPSGAAAAGGTGERYSSKQRRAFSETDKTILLFSFFIVLIIKRIFLLKK